jgi:hypothetical protein
VGRFGETCFLGGWHSLVGQNGALEIEENFQIILKLFRVSGVYIGSKKGGSWTEWKATAGRGAIIQDNVELGKSCRALRCRCWRAGDEGSSSHWTEEQRLAAARLNEDNQGVQH